jgi:hypothetical protein
MEDEEEIRAFLRQKAEELRSKVDASTGIGAIRKFYPEIKALQAVGASHRQIVDFLAEKGIKVKLGTFAGYLTEVRKEDPNYKPPKRRSRTVSPPGLAPATEKGVNEKPSSQESNESSSVPEKSGSKSLLTRDPRREL